MIGAGIGLTVAVAALFAPEAAVVGFLAGTGYLFSQMVAATPAFVHDAVVVSQPERFSAADVAQSHSDLRDNGKSVTLTVASSVGGFATGITGSSIAAAL